MAKFIAESLDWLVPTVLAVSRGGFGLFGVLVYGELGEWKAAVWTQVVEIPPALGFTAFGVVVLAFLDGLVKEAKPEISLATAGWALVILVALACSQIVRRFETKGRYANGHGFVGLFLVALTFVLAYGTLWIATSLVLRAYRA